MIYAVFGEQDACVTATGLTQWDYGQILRIHGVCGLKRTEVHFALDGGGGAIIQMAEVDKNGAITAKIPDRLLETGRMILAYIYVTDQTSGETIRMIKMPVNRRPKPQDYDSPAEKSLLRQLMEKVEQKADGLALEGDELRLTADGKPIGDPVRLPAGEGGASMEPLTEQEIDEIMKGETYVKLLG